LDLRDFTLILLVLLTTINWFYCHCFESNTRNRGSSKFKLYFYS